MIKLKNLALAGVSFFIAGELLTRLLIPSNASSADRTSDHPYLRKDWVPGFSATYLVDRSKNETAQFEINPFGFRSSSMKTREKPPGTTRLFFLGESTTESVTLDEQKTFPFSIETNLNKKMAPQRFEGINAAMSGNLTADSLAHLVYKVMYYEPNIVFVMHAINDLRYGAVPTFDPVHRRDFQRSFYFARFYESRKDSHFLYRLLKQSAFLGFLKRRLFNKAAEPDIYSKWNRLSQKRKSVPFTDPGPSKSLDDYIKNLQEMAFIAKGHGVRFILMTEPNIYQDPIPAEVDAKLWMGYLGEAGLNLSNKFLAREMKRFNDAVRRLAETHSIELIDLEKEIPKTLEYFYDDVHLTAAGTRKVAGIISDYLSSPIDRSIQSATAA